MFPNWITHIPGFRRVLSRRDRRRTRATRPHRSPLRVEELEARDVPSAIPVTSLRDDGSAGTLRSAITEANATAGADVIDLGGLTGTITLTGGQLSITDDLTITGPGANQLAVSGNHASRVLNIQPVDWEFLRDLSVPLTVSISGLTIRDGGEGGDGGGIGAYGPGSLSVSDCTFLNNSAFSGGGIISGAKLTVSNSTFTNNSAIYKGGGIYAGAPLSIITGCTFLNNSALQGGGIVQENVPLTVNSSTFTGNSASDDGGGIFSAGGSGGALFISGSTFGGNSAGGDGGGIASGRGIRIYNSTFADNSSTGRGGGIFIDGGTLSLLSNVTITGNSAATGGGYSGTALLSNTIVARNTAAVGPDITSVFSKGHNLFGDVSGATLSYAPGATGDLVGTADAPINPLLGPLGDYGGPTQTMPLLPLSPALGTGSVALAVDASRNPLITDQRGLPRVVNGLIDIGAYQTQPEPNVTTLPSATGAGAVALQSATGTTITNITAIAPPPPDQRAGTGLPKSAVLPVGTLDFTVNGLAPGATTEVVLYVPTGTVVNSYYKHNPATNKWSKFNSALFQDRNSDGTPDVVLTLTDGGLGDQDGVVNGTIVDPGAPAFVIIDVQIDVRSTVNLASQGLIAVAIFSTADFDARLVDIGTVHFAGAMAVQSALEDLNGDGRLDMVLHFRTQDTSLRALYEQLLADDINEDGVLDSNHQEATVSLTGSTSDNEEFEGSDTIDLSLSGKNLRNLLANLAASGVI